MIKVYIDWNVMSSMRNGKLEEFTNIITNKNKFLLVYSTSHISDIFASIKEGNDNKEEIKSDLEYITYLTNNLCIVTIPQSFTVDYYDPNELFEEEFENKKLLSDFSIDNLLDYNIYGEDFIKTLKELPLDDDFKQALDDQNNSQYLDKLFPDLNTNPTIGGFFKSYNKMFNDSMKTESFKYVKKIVQEIGLNSGYFNDNKNPFDLIEKAYKKYGMTPYDNIKPCTDIPEWFNNLTNDYIILDIHGYKEDKIEVQDRHKKTFRNTLEDSSHTAFASRFDFYITLDNKSIKKSQAVYNKNKVFTKVLKPTEFVEYYKTYLNRNTVNEHFSDIISTICKGEDFYSLINKEKIVIGAEKITCEYFFNYFNKISLFEPEYSDSVFVLSRNNASFPTITFIKEIQFLINLFIHEIGNDINNRGLFEFDEFLEDDIWTIREWKTNKGTIILRRNLGWLQLYFYKI